MTEMNIEAPDGDDEFAELPPLKAAPAPAPEKAKRKPAPVADEVAALKAQLAEAQEALAAAQAASAAVEFVEPANVPLPAKKIRIVLEENDNIPPTGLFLGINGKSYMIRPGEEVDVPSEVVECLNDAVMATPKTDNNGNITDYRNRLRFPYRLISQSV